MLWKYVGAACYEIMKKNFPMTMILARNVYDYLPLALTLAAVLSFKCFLKTLYMYVSNESNGEIFSHTSESYFKIFPTAVNNDTISEI